MNRTEPLTQGEVEFRILAISDALDENTELLSSLLVERATAEADFKHAFAKAMIGLAGTSMPVAAKEAKAQFHTEVEFRSWKLWEAREKACQQKLHSLRSQLDALRTIAANVRAVTR